jgi:hypothetical protein
VREVGEVLNAWGALFLELGSKRLLQPLCEKQKFGAKSCQTKVSETCKMADTETLKNRVFREEGKGKTGAKQTERLSATKQKETPNSPWLDMPAAGIKMGRRRCYQAGPWGSF